MHAAVHREHSVGTPGSVPMPFWLMVLCGIAIFWAGTSFSGGFGSSYFSSDNYSVHPGETAAGRPGAAGGGGESQPLPVAEQGKQFFNLYCAACHQSTGMGTPGQYPPLAKSEFVNGGSRRLAMILLKGIQGHIVVEGKEFNGAMPSWETGLNDKKISAILTYVRQDFGNSAPPIAPEQIAAARKEFAGHTGPWAEADLLAVPVDAQEPGGPAGDAPAPKK